MSHTVRPTRVEIDLDAIHANARVLREVSQAALYAVVKADAYGHGARVVARSLAEVGAAEGFAVSLVEEGCELRDAGIDAPILVMGPALRGGEDEIVGRDLMAALSSFDDIARLAAAAARRGARLPVHLKVDTGMGRLGIAPARVGEALDHIRAHGSLEVVGLMSHLACADGDDPADPGCMSYEQIARFDEAAAVLRARGLRHVRQHLANSSATLLFPEARRDLVRCGLALYGNSQQPERVPRLRQGVRLVTEIAQVREVAAGSSVSYGALWRAPHDARVAVIPIGYADGAPRRLTGVGEVLIAGRRCPMVGAVSMDMTMIDVSALGGSVGEGDEVVLLGEQGDDAISVHEMASWTGLCEYEVTCGLSKRVPRVYRQAERPVRRRSARWQPQAGGVWG
ncbi:alanine racemase [Haliangium ochraceum]|uniref:Alanine racemase n=1 Tax=Haliangium ochraceum (strain DSM 14365 / JCM 11303 / SMP-2) TaxID=502025 RepID=D0LYW2_HALO1|nr:alanine racemase [Haliangium ochraceum]ACY14432.1 alanine racemase [Haliangium ochraceum DSM 14365]